jgi:hypothetical protein
MGSDPRADTLVLAPDRRAVDCDGSMGLRAHPSVDRGAGSWRAHFIRSSVHRLGFPW